MLKKTLAIAAVAGIAGTVAAQYDPGAFWPDYKGGPLRQGSVMVADGPAENLDWTVTTDQPPAIGGISIGSDGMLYFKTRTGDGSLPKVYKVDPSDGSVLASSVGLDGDGGAYAGVALGTNYVWTCVSTTAGGPRVSKIIKLNYADLSVAGEYTNALFDDAAYSAGLRGAPIIGSVLNQRGNVNLYVHMRGTGTAPSGLIFCVDSVTGDVDWSYDPLMGNTTFFGLIGPAFVSGGKMHIAHFGNQAIASGVCVRDNADGTYTEVWFGGPDNFNWLGSGAMNGDGDTIFVTTFNDGDTPSMWAVDALTGAQKWSVPGQRGTIYELNFFGRPAAMGDRVYACGGAGVITCFDDNGSSYTQPWELRPTAVEDPNNPGQFAAPSNTRDAWATEADFFNSGEITAYNVAETASGDRYIYAVMQQQNQDPNLGTDPLCAQFIIVRDDGSSATEILRTNLGETMLPTRYGNSSPTPDAAGNVYVVGGSPSVTGAAPGELYKWSVATPCRADTNGDNTLDFFDVQTFLGWFSAHDQRADFIDDDVFDFFDVQAFLGEFSAGCP